MSVLRVGIADDEPLARERIRSLLDGRPGYEIIVECSDGAEAAAALREHELDVFFLDVQMPDLDGFQALGPRAMLRFRSSCSSQLFTITQSARSRFARSTTS